MPCCPALLIAAPASGQGKTTVVAALARLHARQGRRVRVFKCGPDWLDARWLALASGAPVHSLDTWMTGTSDCARRLAQASVQADVLLVEGAMGLFDGQTASAAALAQRFGLPVLAVVDASGMAATLGAVAHGLRHYAPDITWAGVFANRVASPRHAQLLRGGLLDASDWLGCLPRLLPERALLPARHLGLLDVHEVPDALARLDAAADALADTPLGQMNMQALQRFAVNFAPPDADTAPPAPLLAGRTIAIARDAAFGFIYQANIDTLRHMGARIAFFSPLHGESLPACDALWLPGGYPELHAPALAECHALRRALHAHVAAQRPVWAEGGGMLALLQSLTLADGACLPLWGVLPGHARMGGRLAALGPRQWQLHDARAGVPATLRGHTFHYGALSTTAQVCGYARPPDGDTVNAGTTPPGEAIYQHGSIRAGWFHAWFASNAQATATLFTQSGYPPGP